VDLADLQRIMPQEFAVHWQAIVEFLKIVTEHWPRYLEDNRLVSPVARRNLLMAQETERLAKGSPYPVIAAGSTGTVPATARLLKVIASLPNGAVVLPGLDKTLDNESWDMLAEHPEHPQAGMAELLRKLAATRDDVAYVPGSAPDARAGARLSLASEALRPAESTDHWQHYVAEGSVSEARAKFAEAPTGIRLVVTPTAHDEAEAIALILRLVIETPGKTAALVTPDRVLPRRVAARLKRYGLAIDDSAGVPAARTVPGAFLDLVLGAAESDFAPQALMALLKHPLTLLGRTPGEARAAARALERGAFRDVYVGQGLAGARAALEAARTERRRGPLVLTDPEHDAALGLVADLEQAFRPLAALANGEHPASRLAQAHVAVAEALARDAGGSSSRLWQGEAGEALTVLLAELIDDGGGFSLELADYPPFYRSLIAGQVVRPRAATHPRLFIWGPLEARLQQPDVVILGSLNEGVWPRHQESGPWLSRPMRAALGLSPPERRTGLAAHDFTQALGAREVYLTRAHKVDGVQTVPSRWLQRLLALVRALGLAQQIEVERPWAAWARARDHAPAFVPVSAPEPRPPVEARPKGLSVTQIERWIASPYEIFAKHILKLEGLKELGAEPDPASRGQIVHEILREFTGKFPDALPDDIEGELMLLADRHFARLRGAPFVKAFWEPQFERFARWFARTEPARRAGVARVLSEVKGSLELPGFKLTARADRIDQGENGAVSIYDYKTGRPPVQGHVDKLYAPQLPLEAAIAESGGFENLKKSPIDRLAYIHVSGRDEGGDDSDAAKTDPSSLAAAAVAKLNALIARFADPNMPYEVKRRGGAFARSYDYDEYEHLARLKEWLTQEAEEEFK
jgi:ATP-dependent helicase/nuclease subunit B